jgi:polyketide biosynthesis 3-hydroxy-3-methylglutaryl-CoA synthase-like enzyme PksG
MNLEPMRALTESYLKSLISETASSLDGDFDSSAAFAEIGIDSFQVLKIIKKLEAEFGTLPKTLLFENFNINDLTHYQKRVEGADFAKSFSYLAMHTPFGGMIKGAHRNMMRKLVKAAPAQIEADFERRVVPGLTYCQRVGNIMGATTMLSLASVIDNGDFSMPRRVGCFSYGSGCCSEFFSGIVRQEGQQRLRSRRIQEQLDRRHELSMAEYDDLLQLSSAVKLGTRNVVVDSSFVPQARSAQRIETLFLREIKEFHREYEWAA